MRSSSSRVSQINLEIEGLQHVVETGGVRDSSDDEVDDGPDRCRRPTSSSSNTSRSSGSGVSAKALSLLGIDAHVIRRVKALKLLGVTEEDLAGVGDPLYMDPESLNRQRAFFRAKYPKQARKILQLLGATEGDVLREKALRRLGTSDAMVKQSQQQPRNSARYNA